MDRKRLIEFCRRADLGHTFTRDEIKELADYAARAHYELAFAKEIAVGAGQDNVSVVYPALVSALKRGLGEK